MFKGFFFSIAKEPVKMSVDELYAEQESAHSYIEECEAIGQGIGSKETIRERAVTRELERKIRSSHPAHRNHGWCIPALA